MWTFEDMRAVGSVRGVVKISAETHQSHSSDPLYMSSLATEAAKLINWRLSQISHRYKVESCELVCAVEYIEPFMVRAAFHWGWPQTERAQLVGGASDGRKVAILETMQEFHMPVLTASSGRDFYDSDGWPMTMSHAVDVYKVKGWLPASKAWALVFDRRE